MGIKTSTFGKTASGEEAALVTLVNKKGMSIEVTNYGATLVSVSVPDQKGHLYDVVLGYDDVTDYEKNEGYLGATIGRNGNRIANATVTIDGKEYALDKNEKEHNLHSGFKGFNSVIWDMELKEESLSVVFTHHSPDGDQGFPGNADVSVTYTLTEDDEVKIQYLGKSDADTILNMTNHSYFNLEGHDSGEDVLNHMLWLDADAFTAVDADLIPTGENPKVEATPMDFRTEKKIGCEIAADFEQLKLTGGYDHNFVLNHQGEGMRKIAAVRAEKSGIVMEVYTDLPSVQLYTGNFVTSAQIGKDGHAYDKHRGFCLETQVYPDANHHADFPSSIVRAGEIYETATVYKFSC